MPHECAGGEASEPFDSVTDAWRSVWLALALTWGDDPARAIAGHRVLCQYLAKTVTDPQAVKDSTSQ